LSLLFNYRIKLEEKALLEFVDYHIVYHSARAV